MEPRGNQPVSDNEAEDIPDGSRILQIATSTARRIISPSSRKLNCKQPAIAPAWPFDSSNTNYEKAKEEYKDSPLEKYVATALGDELPQLRDELIERKHEGEGIVERHIRAWAKFRNWKVDPENDLKEKSDPIIKCNENDSDSK